VHTTIQKIRIRDWAYKGKFVVKNTLKKWRQIFGTMLAILGACLTIAESILRMFNTNIVYEWMHEYVILIIIVCVFSGFIVNRIKLKYEYTLRGSDINITLQISDVLNNLGAIVIPTNTTFDTLMEDEFISVNSVQGQFQKRYFTNNLHALDDLIDKSLNGVEYEKIERTGSKQKRYPLGTVSKVTYNGIHYYFVAIADINEYGKPINTSFQNVQIALEGLWNQLELKGHIENLYIPLIGTGKAGIKDATREKVIKEIIFSFVAFSKEKKITEKLLICVHPLDLEQKDLDIIELGEYLRYMCRYRYTDVNARTEGTVL